RSQRIFKRMRVVELKLLGAQAGLENEVNVLNDPPSRVVSPHLSGLVRSSDGQRAQQYPVDRFRTPGVHLPSLDGKEGLAGVATPVQRGRERCGRSESDFSRAQLKMSRPGGAFGRSWHRNIHGP